MDPYQESVKAIVRDAVEMICSVWKERGLSNYAAAQLAHVAFQTPANLIAGPKDPGLAMVVRFWLALEIPPDELARIIERNGKGKASSQLD